MISLALSYILVMWFIGAILVIRVIKTGTFPTEAIAEVLLAGGDIRLMFIVWLLFPILMVPYSVYLLAYYVQYLVYDKKWRKN